jgi:hypothetical protein
MEIENENSLLFSLIDYPITNRNTSESESNNAYSESSSSLKRKSEETSESDEIRLLADLHSVITDSDRHYIPVKQLKSDKQVSNDPFNLISDVNMTLLPQPLEPVSTFSSKLTDQSIDLKSEAIAVETPLLTLIDLNQAVGVNTIKVDETLPDLTLKTNIINDGIISKVQFRDAQDLDPKIAELKTENVDRKSSLKIVDEILCKKVKGKYLPILPKSLETFLFYSEHFCVLSGHRSAKSIIQSISEKFYVLEAERKVKQLTKNCYICSIAKSQKMRYATQGETRRATYPREIMSFDIFGGLNSTPEGYRYVYSFICNFSLFVINIKAKSKSLSELLPAFLQVFACWGTFPTVVCSDNETALMTKDAMDFFKSFGIHHNPGGSHAHWRLLSEGSSIKKSKDFMRATLLSSPNMQWDEALQLGTIALNNTKTTHGFSPFELFFGQTNNKNDLVQFETLCPDIKMYMKTITENKEKLIREVNESRQKSVENRTKLINLHRQSKEFNVNDLVWLKTLNISPQRAVKMKNLGPFRILEKVNPLTFKLAKLSDPQKCVRISHASHLEPYRNAIDITSINFPNLNLNA